MLMGFGLIFSLIFGAVAGSFLNVCIDRIPRGQSVVYPPSHCPACERRLSPAELVPVASFLRQQGRCKECGEQIAPWYPVVEGATGIVFALLYWWYGFGATWIATVVLAGFLIVISGIDLQHRIIPNRVLLAALPLVAVW
ncbi:MAG: prepilin peptidase, partial [Heliobacteriaceae bacterium]|nr:prepilin peptidase [Heliobacteriaceae bacterium]